jgi:hypothetical protein
VETWNNEYRVSRLKNTAKERIHYYILCLKGLSINQSVFLDRRSEREIRVGCLNYLPKEVRPDICVAVAYWRVSLENQVFQL